MEKTYTTNDINVEGTYYNSGCFHLLPCGICEKTNKPCPVHSYRNNLYSEYYVSATTCTDKEEKDYE